MGGLRSAGRGQGDGEPGNRSNPQVQEGTRARRCNIRNARNLQVRAREQQVNCWQPRLSRRRRKPIGCSRAAQVCLRSASKPSRTKAWL